MRRRKPITAAELMADLGSDSAYQARSLDRERQRWEDGATSRAAERPITHDLQKAGFNVKSAWDLANTSTRYDGAIPILVKHLGRSYPDEVLAGVARALGTKEAAPMWNRIIQRYAEIDSAEFPKTKEGLAATIWKLAKPANLAEIVSLITDPRNGESRILLVDILARSRQPIAKETIERLADDPDLKLEIARRRKSRVSR